MTLRIILVGKPDRLSEITTLLSEKIDKKGLPFKYEVDPTMIGGNSSTTFYIDMKYGTDPREAEAGAP